MKTQALVVSAVNAPFVLSDVELSSPQPHEVLIKVTACGLCHTDLAIQVGQFPSAFPMIAGHEGSGIVLEVGSGVTSVQAGDSVLLSFASCTRCHFCRTGHPVGCVTWVDRNFGRVRDEVVGAKGVATGSDGAEVLGSFFGQSAFGRHALVAESSCVKVPEGTDLVTLAPLGCGLQTGAGAVLNVLKPAPSTSIVVFGLGAVGFAAVWAAAYLGLHTIIAIDLVESRRELALVTGATHVLDGKDPELLAKIRELTEGLGADYSIEATGSLRVLRSAWDAIRNFGSVCSVGTPGPGHLPPFDIHDHLNASKRYIGVAEGDSDPPEFIPFLMRLYEEGKFPVDRIAKTFKVEQFDEAVAAMHSGEVIKPIVLF